MERGGKEQRKGTDGNYLHEEGKTGKLSAFDRFRMYLLIYIVKYRVAQNKPDYSTFQLSSRKFCIK